MRSPVALCACVLILALAPMAGAQPLDLIGYHPSPEGERFRDTYEVVGPSLEIASEPHLMLVNWTYASGPWEGIVAGYPEAVLHVRIDLEANHASAWITSAFDAEPDRWLWWPEPVTYDWTGPDTWNWILPHPALIPNTTSVDSNPQTLSVVLGGAMPEPHASLGLLLMAALLGWSRQRMRG